MTTTAPPEVPGHPVNNPRDAAELGIASLILGAVLFLAAPMALILATLAWEFAYTLPDVVLLHAWLTRAGVAVGSLVGIAGIAVPVTGLHAAKRQSRPAGIALAGLLMGIAAIAAWTIASMGLLNTTESLLRIFSR